MDNINLNNRIFESAHTSLNNGVPEKAYFHFYQQDNFVWGEYFGGNLVNKGLLVGYLDENQELEYTFQHLNQQGNIRNGKCHTVIKINENGKYIMYESWAWIDGDPDSGTSVMEEYIQE